MNDYLNNVWLNDYLNNVHFWTMFEQFFEQCLLICGKNIEWLFEQKVCRIAYSKPWKLLTTGASRGALPEPPLGLYP